MSIHYRSDDVLVWHGDCVDLMRELDDGSMDAVVTDPPYGINFKGRAWDRFEPQAFEEWSATWATETLRLLRPGGYLLAFGSTRTAHRLTAGIEDAGFEIRDSIAWLSSKTFPKSKVSLKGIFEPITVARKPGSLPGAPNIDACRLPMSDEDRDKINTMGGFGRAGAIAPTGPAAMGPEVKLGAKAHDLGRWPSNVAVDEEVSDLLGDQARFVYVTANRAERKGPDGVSHPTVKPLALMRWLVKLVTPPGGIVLDPFGGSGTTAEAALLEGFRCMVIEREAGYLPLIVHRIERVER